MAKDKKFPKYDKYQYPEEFVCKGCGNKAVSTAYSRLSAAIKQHKLVCSYECNKKLGQV